jgi:hypothetical protein
MSVRTTLAIEGLEDRLAPAITPATTDPTQHFEANLGYTVNSSTTVVAQSDVVTGAGPQVKVFR